MYVKEKQIDLKIAGSILSDLFFSIFYLKQNVQCFLIIEIGFIIITEETQTAFIKIYVTLCQEQLRIK